MFGERARAYGVPIAFCNLVGGQDELVFDGHSFVVDAGGEVVARARQFEQDLLVWELGGEGPARIEEPLADLDEVYAALVLGVRDYTRKNGFERVLVGLSGGIDSALVAMVAADALGRRTGSPAWSCPPPTPAPRPRPTRARSRPTSAPS